MTTFYTKNDDGEFIEANDAVDELFRERSGRIVSDKLNKERERQESKIRDEIVDEIRKNEFENIKSSVRDELESEYKAKIADIENRANTLDAKLRRKAIATEYGFKAEAEEFLGDGDEESMRAKADLLKSSFGVEKQHNTLKKESSKGVNPLQSNNGINIVI